MQEINEYVGGHAFVCTCLITECTQWILVNLIFREKVKICKKIVFVYADQLQPLLYLKPEVNVTNFKTIARYTKIRTSHKILILRGYTILFRTFIDMVNI
jgi:hypothetical protein